MAGRKHVAALLIFVLLVACKPASETPAPPPPPPQGPPSIIFDRNGHTLAVLVGADVAAVNRDFAPVIEKEAGALALERYVRPGKAIVTTLDDRVQSLAVRSLGTLRGSLVAIDPRTNEILAAASSGPENLALEKQYEPGSVIKVVTLLAALSNGVAVDAMFPYECDGVLPIDGRRFGDWRKSGHGALPNVEEAFAQSCNVVFADIGLRTNRERLQAFHQRLGFDGHTPLGLFRAPLGRKVGDLFNDFETAFYSIGLQHETVTTLHLAMLASMLANRGTLTSPRLVRTPMKQITERVVQVEVAERVIRAMEAVVTRPTGTGRRAAIDGVRIALKTGTAGTEEHGYDAVILGFAPVEQPRIAFALILENAGTAELAGAKVARDFLDGSL